MSSHLICVFSFLTTLSPSVDPIRDAMIRKSEFWFNLVLISSAVVGFGCLLETPETWSAMVRWVALKRGRSVSEDDPTSWHKPVAALGLLLVVIGIGAETIFEGLVSRKETTIRAYDEKTLEDTTLKAGKAKDSAESAAKSAKHTNDEELALERKADALGKRIEMASSKLEKVESSVLLQGPRFRLLEKNRDDFVKALIPFAGQRYSVLECKPDSAEKTLFRSKLYDLLGSGGAHWIFVPLTSELPPIICGVPTIKHNSGSANATQAAMALKNEMTKIKIFMIPEEVSPVPPDLSSFPPDAAASFRSLNAGMGNDLIINDPGLIVISIPDAYPIEESELTIKKSSSK